MTGNESTTILSIQLLKVAIQINKPIIVAHVTILCTDTNDCVVSCDVILRMYVW